MGAVKRLTRLVDLVDDAVFLRFFCGKIEVAVYIALDFLERLASLLCENLVQAFAERNDALRADFDIRGLAFSAAVWLMDHDVRVWKRETLSLRAGCKDDGAHGRCHADS